MQPYYEDDLVTLYHGDCLKELTWIEADVLVSDPPYGRAWRQGSGMPSKGSPGHHSKAHPGIAGDNSTATRDAALAAWGNRPAITFGDLLIAPPTGAVQALIYAKPLDAGIKGARAGFRRDAEAIYLIGPWPAGVGGRTSILRSRTLVGGTNGNAARFGHPHAKPTDLLSQLIEVCPPGVVTDPFAGSGATLVAAKALGRKAIGVELEEKYCEVAAKRLAQDVLDLSGWSA